MFEEPLEAVAGHAGEPSRRRGLPRRSTDRNTRARLGQLALAVTAIITTKLTKWADRYHHTQPPTCARSNDEAVIPAGDDPGIWG